jgi:hypothetical protein
MPETPSSVAAQLNYDQDAIFAFVRDEIHFESYAGVLHGAQGTLWSRAGNSADQATLIAALLDASAIPCGLDPPPGRGGWACPGERAQLSCSRAGDGYLRIVEMLRTPSHKRGFLAQGAHSQRQRNRRLLTGCSPEPTIAIVAPAGPS